MATVLSLKSSPLLSEEKIETVFNTRDFMYLVDKYMGYDAMRYFRELVEDYDETINNLNCEIKEMIQEVQTAHE